MLLNNSKQDLLKENSGIEASLTEDDLRDYMSVVMNELKIGGK
jgi:hypothetical protein